MTKKKEQILTVALSLFSKDGFDGTSTNKIAKEAGVSEGLIFRHFKNKEGLLAAILEFGSEKAQTLYLNAFAGKNTKEVLKNIISIPFIIDEIDHNFWRLMYALKWQANTYDKSHSAVIKNKLIEVFTELRYKNPTAEAEVVLLFIDGAATSILLKQPDNSAELLDTILNKYHL